MRSAIEGIAAYVKLLHLPGEFLLEDCANFPFSIGPLHSLKLLSICPLGHPSASHGHCLQGLQLHYKRRRSASVCWEPHFGSLLQQIHQLLGVVRPILDQQQYQKDNIMWTTFH